MGAWVGAALTGLSALSGLFGNKKQVSDTNFNNTTMPSYDPTTLAFRDFLIKSFTDNAGGAGLDKFIDAYKAKGLKNLVLANANTSQAVQDMLASRGIDRTTAGASALTDTSYRGASNTADFLNNIPILRDSMMQDRLKSAAGFQASLPVGTTQSGSSHTVGNVGPSSPVAGLLGGGSAGLATWLGQQSANQQFANILKSLPKG